MEDKQLEEALAESIEKSFNDSELEDIMNEIENLEKEFSSDVSEKEAGLSLQKAKDNDLQKVIDAEVESIATHIDEAEEPMAVQEDLDVIPEEMFMEEQEMERETSHEITDEITSESEDEATLEMSDESEDDFNDEDFAQMEDDSDEMIASSESDANVETYEESEELIAQDFADIEAAVTQMEEESNVVELSSSPAAVKTQSKSSSSELDFNASGTMDLSINFKIAGQIAHLKVENGGLVVNLNGVQLSIDETNGCSVKMAGGVQFSVPLNPTATSSKKDVA